MIKNDFVIARISRAGTTSVWNVLSTIPEIGMWSHNEPRVFPTETGMRHRYAARLDNYLQRFREFIEFHPPFFRSMLFMFLTQTPLNQFCCVSKNERLLGSIGLDDFPTVDAMSIVNDGVGCVASYGPGILAPHAKLLAAKSRADAAIDKVVTKWGYAMKSGQAN